MNPLLDVNTLPTAAIALESEQIDLALQLSERVSPPSEQWQTYLNALALFGFEQWLATREPRLPVDKSQCTLFAPEAAKLLGNALARLQVGDFRLCLLTGGTLTDEVVVIPRAVLAFPDYLAHFYVLTTVDEEQEQTAIEGFISYQGLMAHQRALNLSLQPDDTYEVPLSWFDGDSNQLLLYLRCLEATPIFLPAQSPFSSLAQGAVNVALWLQGELDALSEGLAWILLPQPAFATVSFRSLPTLSIILEELQERGIYIAPDARVAYQDFSMGEHSFRLYALTWLLSGTNEWSLLLILGMQSDDFLLEGLQLQVIQDESSTSPPTSHSQVSDSQSLLWERTINAAEDETYLYALVVGGPDEQFTVKITLMDGQSLTFPPFIFKPDRLP